MFYLESKDLALAKKRKVNLLLDSICDLRDLEIRNLIQSPIKSLDEMDGKLEAILDRYRMAGNSIVQYYYPESDTLTLDDREDLRDD